MDFQVILVSQQQTAILLFLLLLIAYTAVAAAVYQVYNSMDAWMLLEPRWGDEMYVIAHDDL